MAFHLEKNHCGQVYRRQVTRTPRRNMEATLRCSAVVSVSSIVVKIRARVTAIAKEMENVIAR